MILAVDMGNTQTALGLFDGTELVHSWRMPTDRTFTKDEINVRLQGYFRMYDLALSCVGTIAFAGVVPQLTREWEGVARQIGSSFIAVGRDTAAVTHVHADNPLEVGADRIANAVAAATLYGSPAIVVDFGTATNIDVVNAEGAYIGGTIAPGIRISMEALVARAAQLASVPLVAPERVIGRNTIEAVQNGIVVGTAAMAEGLVNRIKKELGTPDARVIATGGLASIVATSTDAFDVIDPTLTLRGICEINRRMEERESDE